MSVGIGSFSDPEHMQGVSHYLEHMLFMGSSKYPDENEYDDYITKHGGMSNAYTELEYTNYHFEVSPGDLHGALDRFAQFFMDPLFKEDSLEREVLAVDSEFSGVVQNDQCRLSQLICHTAVEGHMYRKFSWGNKKSLWDEPQAAGIDIRSEIVKYYNWGNKKSLWDEPQAAGIDIRSEIVKYYNKHYCAERMSLVVLGGETLDELQQYVTDIFSHLPTGKGPRPTFEGVGMPFKGRNFYSMPAVRDHHEISIIFQTLCLYKHYHKKADHYISHLVGHEGPGSLLSLLKARGWATNVCAGMAEEGHYTNSARGWATDVCAGMAEEGHYTNSARGWATDVCAGMAEEGHYMNSVCYLFSINITLTEAGLAAGEHGLGLGPIELAFQYLQMMSEMGPQKWVWDELKAISEMKFMFQEETEAMDYVTSLSATTHLLKPHVHLKSAFNFASLHVRHTEEDEAMDYVTNLSATMHLHKPEHLLVADYLHTEWDPALISQLMSMMHPTQSSYRIDLLTKDFSTDFSTVKQKVASLIPTTTDEAPTVTEPWFGLEAVYIEHKFTEFARTQTRYLKSMQPRVVSHPLELHRPGESLHPPDYRLYAPEEPKEER
eukprot:gene21127-28014_t